MRGDEDMDFSSLINLISQMSSEATGLLSQFLNLFN